MGGFVDASVCFNVDASVSFNNHCPGRLAKAGGSVYGIGRVHEAENPLASKLRGRMRLDPSTVSNS